MQALPRSPSTCRAAAKIRCSTAILRPSARFSPGSIICRSAPRSTARSVGVWGGSFGAYWAARLAYTAADRIKGAVFHGGNVHYGFQKEWLIPAFTTGGATYLFGAHSLLEARGRAMGTKTLEEFLEAAPRLSLKTLGLLDKPSAPILGVNGKLDDQAPVDDIYLLMEHGSPKSARIYPQGLAHGPHARRAVGPYHDDHRRVAQGAVEAMKGVDFTLRDHRELIFFAGAPEPFRLRSIYF